MQRGWHIPSWSNDPDPKVKPINVRAESVMFKFGEQLREKRCLIPASGFYEWATVGGRKGARHFTMKDGRLFAFAGLWDVWRWDGKPLLTCCLIPDPVPVEGELDWPVGQTRTRPIDGAG